MNLDDPVCLCFHVSRRKVIKFIRIEKPRRPSQLSECFGAGTGCGWCRPYLERILEKELTKQNIEQESAERAAADLDVLQSDDYAKLRQQYIEQGKGKPPGGSS